MQDVERFRMRYARHYKLRDFALMLVTKVKIGSFIVSFVIPGLYVKLLRQNIPKDILQEFSVKKFEIHGSSEHLSVLQPLVPKHLVPSAVPDASYPINTTTSPETTSVISSARTTGEDDSKKTASSLTSSQESMTDGASMTGSRLNSWLGRALGGATGGAVTGAAAAARAGAITRAVAGGTVGDVIALLSIVGGVLGGVVGAPGVAIAFEEEDNEKED